MVEYKEAALAKQQLSTAVDDLSKLELKNIELEKRNQDLEQQIETVQTLNVSEGVDDDVIEGEFEDHQNEK